MRHLLLIILLTINFACQKAAEPTTSPEAEGYLGFLVSNVENHSLNRKTINWETFKQNVLIKASGAQTINDPKTKEAILLALTQLQGPHYRKYYQQFYDNKLIRKVRSSMMEKSVLKKFITLFFIAII